MWVYGGGIFEVEDVDKPYQERQQNAIVPFSHSLTLGWGKLLYFFIGSIQVLLQLTNENWQWHSFCALKHAVPYFIQKSEVSIAVLPRKVDHHKQSQQTTHRQLNISVGCVYSSSSSLRRIWCMVTQTTDPTLLYRYNILSLGWQLIKLEELPACGIWHTLHWPSGFPWTWKSHLLATISDPPCCVLAWVTGTLQWLAKYPRWPMNGVALSPVSNTVWYWTCSSTHHGLSRVLGKSLECPCGLSVV